MNRIWGFDIENITADKGILVYDGGDFVGVVVFNMRSHYQIIKSNGIAGREYDSLKGLIVGNTLYNFYNL